MNWGEIRQEYESTNITLKALAEKHDIKIGTLKSRKSREGWSRGSPEKDATKKKKVAPPEPRKRSGNPNPQNQFTKRNKAAEKHGLFSKFLPSETLEIMESLNERSPADLIWDQIQIQYAAIIRAQQIMFVRDKDDIAKELKKARYDLVPDPDVRGEFKQVATEEEYDFQFAWDRQATFLNAQSRAMGELRSLIKQFDDMAHIDDELRLKLEGMRLGIEKTKAEIDKIQKGDDDTQEKDVAAALRGLVDGINSKAD